MLTLMQRKYRTPSRRAASSTASTSSPRGAKSTWQWESTSSMAGLRSLGRESSLHRVGHAPRFQRAAQDSLDPGSDLGCIRPGELDADARHAVTHGPLRRDPHDLAGYGHVFRGFHQLQKQEDLVAHLVLAGGRHEDAA